MPGPQPRTARSKAVCEAGPWVNWCESSQVEPQTRATWKGLWSSGRLVDGLVNVHVFDQILVDGTIDGATFIQKKLLLNLLLGVGRGKCIRLLTSVIVYILYTIYYVCDIGFIDVKNNNIY